MKVSRIRNILFLLMVVSCVWGGTSACGSVSPDKTNSGVSTEPTALNTTAENTTMAPATQTPITTPTPEPTLTPTPTPGSVYIPRETLPDGQLLETGYYAVLPGEGAYYNVYDCYGKQIDSFLFTNGESNPPIGIFTETQLTPYCQFNRSEVQTIIPVIKDDYNSALHSTQNGFYQKEYYNGKVILYDKDGKYLRTLKLSNVPSDTFVDTVVRCMGDETVVSFSTQIWDDVTSTSSFSIVIYFVASDGTINDVCKADNFFEKPVGLVGRKYFLVYSDTENSVTCDMVDFKGRIVITGVNDLPDSSFGLWSQEAVTSVKMSDTYVKDGILYDSSLHAIQKNQLGADGQLIYGNTYDVSGIPCEATQWKNNYHDSSEIGNADLVAVGTQSGKIAIKTNKAEYVFDNYNQAFSGMNDSVLVLGGRTFISLETGKVLLKFENPYEMDMEDNYVIVKTGGYTPSKSYHVPDTIIDNEGNVRYMSAQSSYQGTQGNNIILYRGPYVGIADLNGDWVIKTLQNDLTRDDEATNPLKQN